MKGNFDDQTACTATKLLSTFVSSQDQESPDTFNLVCWQISKFIEYGSHPIGSPPGYRVCMFILDSLKSARRRAGKVSVGDSRRLVARSDAAVMKSSPSLGLSYRVACETLVARKTTEQSEERMLYSRILETLTAFINAKFGERRPQAYNANSLHLL